MHANNFLRRSLVALTALLALDTAIAESPSTANTNTNTNTTTNTTTPLILRAAETTETEGERSRRLIAERVIELRETLVEIDQSDDPLIEKERRKTQLRADNSELFRSIGPELEGPLEVYLRTLKAERRFYQSAAEEAPDDESRQRLLNNAPSDLGLPQDTQPLTEVRVVSERLAVPTAKTESSDPDHSLEPVDTSTLPNEIETPAPVTADSTETEVKVEVLADAQVTSEMHDDTTILRDVTEDASGLTLFDGLHVWAGGSIAIEHIHVEGLLNNQSGGDGDSSTESRRQEVTLRATVFDLGEVKFQYDIEGSIVRDAYFRWVATDGNQWVTVGNQKEPMGADFLEGSKFSIAMERSAPATAFGSFRARGISYSRAFSLQGDDRMLDIWKGDTTYLNTTVGIYGEDVEGTNNTDYAVTGRISGGTQTASGLGRHYGLSATYRDGDFDRIAPRPGIQKSDRILLAQPVADQQLAIAGETFFSKGSLHVQAEAYYSDYRGGLNDGIGWGGYMQGGWLFNGEVRSYRPKYGLWAPIGQHGEKRHIFEVIARASYTHGEDDINDSNALAMLTLGGNWYYQRWRVGLNLIATQTDRDVNGEDSGIGAVARVQVLF